MTAHPTVAHIRELPLAFATTVTGDFIDGNGHMNVRHYFDLQETAATVYFGEWGIDEGYPERTGFGVFALEQHLTYLSECLEGESLSVYVRVVATGDKTIHSIGYLVNDSRDTLAHVVETMTAHIDLSTRRVAPWPAEITSVFAGLANDAPSWKPLTAACLKVR